MAAPRKTTQPANTESGDNTTPLTEEEKVRVAAAEQQAEQTPHPEPTTEPADPIDYAKLAAEAAQSAPKPPTSEEVTLTKEVGGHKSGATITVTPGSAEYLREQGYVEDSEGGDED